MDASHPFEYPEYEEHVVPKSIYFGVFGALMVLTVVTVAVAFVDLGNLNVVVALAVARAQGDAGRAVLHAREVQSDADETGRDFVHRVAGRCSSASR